MSTTTLVLNGNRRYGSVTYSENNDPQTLTANLSDSASMADVDTAKATKPLTDTETLSDVITKLVNKLLADTTTLTEARIIEAVKALSDSTTLSEARAFAFVLPIADILSEVDARVMTATKVLSDITTSTPNLYSKTLYGGHTYSSDFTAINIYMRDALVKEILRLFSESLSIADSTVVVRQTKGFLDFILLQSWLRLDLHRADIWTVTPASPDVTIALTLYDNTLYGGSRLYAATPKVTWTGGSVDVTVWQKAVEITSTQPLYAKAIYGSFLPGAMPVVFWTGLPKNNEAWTNEDGHTNQES